MAARSVEGAASSMQPDLTVVIMAYNEAASLEATVTEIAATIDSLDASAEIVIVDDGSTDGTGSLADDLERRLNRVRVVRHAENLGLGGVYRTGFREARGRNVTFFPADGQFPASIIGLFFPLMTDVDMVLGYLPRQEHSLVGKALSATERILYRGMFGAFPTFQGILMFRRSMLRELPLTSDGRGWSVLMEFILRASRGHYRLRSVPTDYRPRRFGSSKVTNVRTVSANFRELVGLWRRFQNERTGYEVNSGNRAASL